MVQARFEELLRSAREVTRAYSESRDVPSIDLNTIATCINRAYREMEACDVNITGMKGAGKTTLALRLAAGAYGGWGRALESLLFTPKQLLAVIYGYNVRGERARVVIIDDAGSWLSKWFLTTSKVATLELLELSRTVISSIIYTNINTLPRHIRSNVRWVLRVVPLSPQERASLAVQFEGGETERLLMDKSVKWSKALVYSARQRLDGSERYSIEGVFIYPVRMPREIYERYMEVRRRYVTLKASEVLKRVIAKEGALEFLEAARSVGVEAEIRELLREMNIEAS